VEADPVDEPLAPAEQPVSTDAPSENAEPESVPLTRPADGVPPVITELAQLRAAADALAAGSGPVAMDTERASGYRYSQRAYLIQLRRDGAGTVLVDPIPFGGDLSPLATALADTEWVLHAASQDLPCLAELDLHPESLFDTELAGRLAGYDRVALGTLVERLLGFQLEKGHGAADWSQRPLPADWLNYAALDVELLIPLRDTLERELADQGKLTWALEEFEAVRTAPPPRPRPEPWRRTSGIHRLRTPRQLAAVRALWQARDVIARERDLSPGRVLPDRAVIEAALTDPADEVELVKLAVFRGRAQRRLAGTWTEALRSARALPKSELPDPTPPARRAAATEPLGGQGPGRGSAAGRGAGRAHLDRGRTHPAGGEPAATGPGPPDLLGTACHAGRVDRGGRAAGRRGAGVADRPDCRRTDRGTASQGGRSRGVTWTRWLLAGNLG